MKNPYTLTLFTPGEAEKITTVSTTMQRDWRRHGYLPQHEGHARFDAFELATMWTLKMLSDRGVGPQLGTEVAEWCSLGIVRWALHWKDAYEGDYEKALLWYPEKRLQEMKERTAPAISLAVSEFEDEIEAAIKEFDVKIDIEELKSGSIWGDQAIWLSKQILRMKSGGELPASLFIWFADNSYIFHTSVDEALKSRLDSDPSMSGPVLILDLKSLGSQLLDKAKRPLVHVEFQTDPETEKPLPPIEYGAPVPFPREN